MVKRLLVSEKIIQENVTELVYHNIHDGGCQCFKDCDCYRNKGNVIAVEVVYTNPISLKKHNGKRREFSSIIGCISSYNSVIKNNLTKS